MRFTHANEMSQLSNEELARLTRKGNSAAILERLIGTGIDPGRERKSSEIWQL